MRSPVSRCASGEGNAIKGPEFDPSELTFVSALDTEFGASPKPISSQPSGSPTISSLEIWPLPLGRFRKRQSEPCCDLPEQLSRTLAL